jgi:two-component system, OmpR family, sensor histidine kinase KdpD
VPNSAQRSLRIAVAVGTVGAITALYYKFFEVNPTTIALSYLLAILTIATAWGILEATIASVLAMVCFNFYFLPPVGTLTIADPQNWIALVAFLATAIVASQLSGRARRRELEMIARQRDLERLYALSRAQLLWSGTSSPAGAIANDVASVFGLQAVALYDARADTIHRAGPADLTDIDGTLRAVARQGLVLNHRSGATITAIRLGGAPIGSLALSGEPLSDTVVQSIANLAAIALERAAGQLLMARAEAARRSGELRATLLDAVAHEFKTPLTSIKAAATALAEKSAPSGMERELATIIGEESERLDALVSDATQMLRLESGDFALHPRPHRMADVVEATIGELHTHLDGRTVATRVPPDLQVVADAELLRLALRHLADNAVKYSPPGSAMQVSARVVEDSDSVEIAVQSGGPPIPINERAAIFDRFYRGDSARSVPGSGMGLAIVQQVARAHGGDVSLHSTDAGNEFRLTLPRRAATA